MSLISFIHINQILNETSCRCNCPFLNPPPPLAELHNDTLWHLIFKEEIYFGHCIPHYTVGTEVTCDPTFLKTLGKIGLNSR